MLPRTAFGDAVIRFKASVDELSRLCAGRSEDEQLVGQLDKQLASVSATVAARILLECRFREEWRDEKNTRALHSLPRVAGEAEAVNRMRDYVAMLAPPRLYESTGEPWQHELLKQQQAIARVLQLCPGNSPDAILRTLTEFMGLSRQRLVKQLDLLQWKVSEKQNSRPAERASSQPGSPPKGGADNSAVLTADAFLERLQRQRSAVCTLQTRVRGKQQQRRYRQLVRQRLEAGVRLQAAARRRAAWRQAGVARDAARRVKQQRMAERNCACRLQRARRWVLLVRDWRRRWQERAGAAERAALDGWRREMRCYARLARSSSEKEFSSFAHYVPGTKVLEKREAEYGGAAVAQAIARGFRDRILRRRCLNAAVRIQAGWRGWRGRTRGTWWRRALARLHEERSSQLRWSALVSTTRALLPVQSQAVLLCLHAGKEVDAVRRDAAREMEDFEASFAKFARAMRKATLAKKLHSDWIPQMDPATGGTYYFNLKTAETTQESPNLRVVRATEKKERGRAEARLRDRLAKLQGYVEAVEERAAEQLKVYDAQMGIELRAGTVAWRRACCFPGYWRAERGGRPPGASQFPTRAASVLPTPRGGLSRMETRTERVESPGSSRNDSLLAAQASSSRNDSLLAAQARSGVGGASSGVGKHGGLNRSGPDRTMRGERAGESFASTPPSAQPTPRAGSAASRSGANSRRGTSRPPSPPREHSHGSRPSTPRASISIPATPRDSRPSTPRASTSATPCAGSAAASAAASGHQTPSLGSRAASARTRLPHASPRPPVVFG